MAMFAPVIVGAVAGAYLLKTKKIPQPREVINDLFRKINDHSPSTPPSDSEILRAMKAEHKARVDRLLDEDLEEAMDETSMYDFGNISEFHSEIYSGIKLESEQWPIDTQLSYQIFTMLDYIDITMMVGVNRSWSVFARTLRKDLLFLDQCARVGFNEGITGTLRGRIWMQLTGADLLMTSMQDHTPDQNQPSISLYNELLERLRSTEHDSPDLAASREIIAKDVPRTIVHLAAFTSEKDAAEALSNVLSVYAICDATVSYAQGMNFVAGYLLTKVPQEAAYWLLHAIMFSFKYDMRSFYLPDLRGLLLFKYQFQILFSSFLPCLSAHFIAENVYTDVITEFIMTVFTCRIMPRRTVDAIWDHFLVFGQPVLHQVALAILKLYEPILLHLPFEECIFTLKYLPDSGILDPNVLMPVARSFKVTRRMLRGLEIEYLNDQEKQQQLRDDEELARSISSGHSSDDEKRHAHIPVARRHPG